MENVRFLKLWWAMWLVLVLCAACGKRKQEQQLEHREEVVQMLKQKMAEGQNERVLELTDSLEEAGELSSAMANGVRGMACYFHGEYRRAEFFVKKAMAGNALLEESPRHYVYLGSLLAGLLMPRQEYEEAISVATRTYAVAKEHGEDIEKSRVASLLNTIGQCEVELGKLDEGEMSLSESCQMQRRLAQEDTTSVAARTLLLFSMNAAIAYMNGRHYERALQWLEELDDLVEAPVGERMDSAFLDMSRGRLHYMRADALARTGNLKDAATEYEKALATEYGHSPDGRIDAGSYLEAVGRWSEAAETYVALDSLMHRRGIPMTVDNLQALLAPEFTTYVKAGRQSEAIAVGLRICEALDSAVVWQRRDETAELATIYETQEKEAKIAEQAASLASERLFATVVAVLLIVISLVVFSVIRYRAAQRLNVEHKRLLQAYDLLGDANRRLETANQELEQKNADLVVANARAEESSIMKTTFIEQISHEIRTPLNILSGFTQVATAPGIVLSDEEKEEISKGIVENTNRITGLVNKMLELSDVSSQTVIERKDRVSVMQIAEEAIESSGIRKASHLVFNILPYEGAEQAEMQTSRSHAVRALSLLLDNACKFTRPAEAIAGTQAAPVQQVRLRLHREAGKVVYTVEDTGVGIPKEEAEHIFEKFVQLDNYYDGTGIGLTVARSLIRRLDGDIVLDTDYTQGARFVMTLPFEETDS